MKVISLAPSNTEIVYALDQEDSLIATTSLCDYPTQARKKQNVGGWTSGINYAKIERLNPDLILTSDSLQEEVREKLDQRGFEVFHVSPSILEEVYETIRAIASLYDKENKSEEIIRGMKNTIEETDLKNKRIYCEEWHKPPMVAGNWIPDLIDQADGRYFIQKGRSRKFELDKLKSFDPEHIFLNICGAGTNIDKKLISSRDDWQSITAVQEGNIHVINDSLLNRPSPRLSKGIKNIEKQINYVS